MFPRVVLAALLISCASVPAAATTSEVSAAGFVVTHVREIRATPQQVFERLGQVDQWWNPQHTQALRPGTLSLDLTAGGCFCERWDGNSVQHGLVTYVRQHAMLRMDSSLGPLHRLPVKGILTIQLMPKDDRTLLELNYRVGGTPNLALDRFATALDRVLGEQVQRLGTLIETGRPD